MATTAEELASQAQQLQAAISFFKVGTTPGTRVVAATERRTVRPVRASAKLTRTAPSAKANGSAANGSSPKKSNGATIVLDEGENGHAEDSDFQRY